MIGANAPMEGQGDGASREGMHLVLLMRESLLALLWTRIAHFESPSFLCIGDSC